MEQRYVLVSKYKVAAKRATEQTGLLPGIVGFLQSQSALAQETMDAATHQEALMYLQRCRNCYRQLSSLANQGRLPEAVREYDRAQDLLRSIPSPLSQANVTVDMKVSARNAIQLSH